MLTRTTGTGRRQQRPLRETGHRFLLRLLSEQSEATSASVRLPARFRYHAVGALSDRPWRAAPLNGKRHPGGVPFSLSRPVEC